MKPGADAPATDGDDRIEQGVEASTGPVVPGQRVGPEHRTEPESPDHDPDRTEPESTLTRESATAPARGLTAREREILGFERRWWKHAGAKEQAIRDSFDISATRYYQLLNGLLDNPAALAAEPVLVARLRRLRAARSRTRRR
ncbi:DUF3263 domain-containing protein [Micromonospora sp. NBC_01699]|uniref:DUF3263 domain-containing protein n=1 Tax=Micromonospora sp. NBC_01699 TaxID=2975984 RepID=UPI002E2E40F5|nr:DUF3263 domain-containing protein [Micromonospora sp. NBC_01699]